MERFVAIILALLVIVVGFLIVKNIVDGQEGISNVGDSVQCSIQGGSCTTSCNGERLEASCPSGQECCRGS